MKYKQRSRQKGASLPPNTKVCTRKTRFGNPFTIGRTTGDIFTFCIFDLDDYQKYRFGRKVENAAESIRLYKKYVVPFISQTEIKYLKTFDYLSCFCAPGEKCHVQDVLIPLVEGRYDHGQGK